MVIDAKPVCPSCRQPVEASAPLGLCPACLIKSGLNTGGEPCTTAGSGSGFVPESLERIAKCFPQLEILGLIGRGGMGAVYRARQRHLDRVVALKILPLQAGLESSFTERFAREAKALARLNHPNIVAIYDSGQQDGFYYFLMEFVDGVNLRQLEQSRRQSPEEALALVPPICEALQYAHQQGIVHRDIKPENILVDKQGRVKIADFGIAKVLGSERQGPSLTGAQQVMGTPHYMAPEQVEHPQEVDHRADIYSLGVVFYEMLTGELPLGKFAPPSSRTHGMQIDVRLDEVVLHALEKEPGRRYQHASEVKTDVETIATGSAEQPSTPTSKKQMTTDRLKGFRYGLAAAAACVVIGAGIWLALTRGGGNAKQLAQEGWQLWQATKHDEAAAKFRQAVRLDPRQTNAWNGLGWACFNSGKWPEAEQAFQSTLALDGNHPAALNGLGQLYLAQKKNDLAETYLLKAAPRAPAAWYGLAQLYLLQGKFERAEEWAGKVVDSGQGDDTARQMLQAARAKRVPEGLRLILEPQ